MFCYQTAIKLHHTDAAGVVFFSDLFVIAHDGFESFLGSDLTLGSILADEAYCIPIVHAEADYCLPLTVSEIISVEISLGKIRDSSFELNYTVKNQRTETAARLKIIHTVLSKKDRMAVPVPDSLRGILESLY